MKRESKPHYLQDAVLPKETERKGGFNLDGEFGGGISAELKEGILKGLQSEFADFNTTLRDTVFYRILFNEHPPNSDLNREECRAWIEDDMEIEGRKILEFGPLDERVLSAAQHVAYSRVIFGESSPLSDEVLEHLLQGLREYWDVQEGKWLVERKIVTALSYRLLTGHNIESIKENFFAKLKQEFMLLRAETAKGMSNWTSYLAEYAAAYRILKAHDLRFIPGKGIEIIDDPPETFEKKTEPMPEERKF